MGYNFPNSPNTGDTYAPVGGPVWRFDGFVWKQEPVSTIEEAPIDDQFYGRSNAQWEAIPPPGTASWDAITGKPATFPPTVPIAWTDVSGKPATFPPATHSHPESDITNLVSDLAGKAPVTHIHAQADVTGLPAALTARELTANKGVANGYAPLDASIKIAATYLPAYVDDVVEYANLGAFPGTGTAGIIYVALDTNKVYRWGGSSYTEISPSPGSTDAVPEGSVNLYYTDARVAAAPALAAKASLSGATFTGKVTIPPAVAGGAFLNIGQSALNPSPLVNGDMWLNGFNLFINTTGGAFNIAYLSGSQTFSGTRTFSVPPIMSTPTTAQASMRLPHGVAPSAPTDGDLWTTTAGLFGRVNGATVGPLTGATDISGKVSIAGDTMTGKLNTLVPTTGTTGLNLGPTAVTPTSPANGDIWATTVGDLLARLAGTTYTLANLQQAQTFSTGVKTFTGQTIQSNAWIGSGADGSSSGSGLTLMKRGSGFNEAIIFSDGAGGARGGIAMNVAGSMTFRVGDNVTDDVSISTAGLVNAAGGITSTTGTYSGVLTANGNLKINAADGVLGFLYAGATMGLRIVASASGVTVEGVDPTGVGSFQPLRLSGSLVNVVVPLTTTTITTSGDVTLTKATPVLSLNKAASGQDAGLAFKTAAALRWQLVSNSTPESADAGSDFGIRRYNDAGTLQDTPFSIIRLTGVSTISSAAIGTVDNASAGGGMNLYKRASGNSEAIYFSDGAGGYRGAIYMASSGSLNLRIGDNVTDDVSWSPSGNYLSAGNHKIYYAAAIPAGGTAGAGYLMSSVTNFGTFFGSGAPTISAAKGSHYYRSDGSVGTYTYVNTDGATAWTPLLDTAAGVLKTADAFNRLVNPAMQLSQEQGNTALTTVPAYSADQWRTMWVSAGTFTYQRVQVVTPNGSANRLRITVNTADATVDSADYLVWQQMIEGSRIAEFKWGTAAARQVIVRFGFKGPAGTYACALVTGAGTYRSYIMPFTISAGQANTDTEQVFVVPGDQTMTFITGNTLSMTLAITLAAGATFASGADLVWKGGYVMGSVGQTNGMGTAGSVFELFDVGIYMDPSATGKAPTWNMPDEAAELLACQRYYQKLTAVMSGNVTTATVYYAGATYVVTPRIVPPPSASGVSILATSFPATSGTITNQGAGVSEARTANATATGVFGSTISVSARM